MTGKSVSSRAPRAAGKSEGIATPPGGVRSLAGVAAGRAFAAGEPARGPPAGFAGAFAAGEPARGPPAGFAGALAGVGLAAELTAAGTLAKGVGLLAWDAGATGALVGGCGPAPGLRGLSDIGCPGNPLAVGFEVDSCGPFIASAFSDESTGTVGLKGDTGGAPGAKGEAPPAAGVPGAKGEAPPAAGAPDAKGEAPPAAGAPGAKGEAPPGATPIMVLLPNPPGPVKSRRAARPVRPAWPRGPPELAPWAPRLDAVRAGHPVGPFRAGQRNLRRRPSSP